MNKKEILIPVSALVETLQSGSTDENTPIKINSGISSMSTKEIKKTQQYTSAIVAEAAQSGE